jgi:site-specific recombinase XerD
LSIGVACPTEGCGGYLTKKRSGRGKIFYGCSRYPECKFAAWDKPTGEKCSACRPGLSGGEEHQGQGHFQEVPDLQGRVPRLKPRRSGAGKSMIESFLRHLRAEVAPRTVEAYGRDLRAFFAAGEPPECPSLASRRTRCGPGTFGGDDCAGARSPRSVARAWRRCGAFSATIISSATSPPIRPSACGRRACPDRCPKFIDEAGVLAVLDLPDLRTARGRRDRAVLELLYGTGIRLGELAGSDSRRCRRPRGETLRVLGKGSKERILPLTGVVRRTLDAYLAATPVPRPPELTGACRSSPDRAAAPVAAHVQRLWVADALRRAAAASQASPHVCATRSRRIC